MGLSLAESLDVRPSPEGWGGGGEYSRNVYTGRLQPLTFLHTIFQEKGTSFVCLLLTNGTSFIYLVYNFCILLTAVNALSFK